MNCNAGYGLHCQACETNPACDVKPLSRYEVTDYKGNIYIVEARDGYYAKQEVCKQKGKGASYSNIQGMKARKIG